MLVVDPSLRNAAYMRKRIEFEWIQVAHHKKSILNELLLVEL